MRPAPRVLVVDDDDSIREILELVLQERGMDVVTAANGLEALERCDTWTPDVIILDMRMPVMDGWEFARAYRARPVCQAAIVVATAATDARASAAEVGADACLAKPFDLDEMIAVVESNARHALRDRDCPDVNGPR